MTLNTILSLGLPLSGKLSTSDLLDRDTELMQCIETDPRNGAQYRAVLYRDGFIEGNRFFKYMLCTQQLPDFATWELSAGYAVGELPEKEN